MPEHTCKVFFFFLFITRIHIVCNLVHWLDLSVQVSNQSSFILGWIVTNAEHGAESQLNPSVYLVSARGHSFPVYRDSKSRMGSFSMYITGPNPTIASLAANRLAEKKAHCWGCVPQLLRGGACTTPHLGWAVRIHVHSCLSCNFAQLCATVFSTAVSQSRNACSWLPFTAMTKTTQGASVSPALAIGLGQIHCHPH